MMAQQATPNIEYIKQALQDVPHMRSYHGGSMSWGAIR